MEILLSDGGANGISRVMKNFSEILGIGRVQAYPFHLQSNGTVEQRTRTLIKDLACFMSIGESDRDDHMALHCFQFNI